MAHTRLIPNETVKVLGTWPVVTFHKGRRYKFTLATNQPEWKEKGKVFAVKADGSEVLLQAGEYRFTT